MKKIILILLVLALFMVSCTSYQTTQASVPKTSTQQGIVSQPASATEPIASSPLTINVIIKNFAFAPNTMTIKAGTTIVWTNQDSAPHIIKFDSFESDTLPNGGSYEHKFDTAGTYDYFCSIHPSMKGQIIVE